MTTPSAVKRPCNVTSIPQLLKMTGSIPISMESSIALIIVCRYLGFGARRSGEAPQFPRVPRVCRGLSRERGPGRGYSSPKPSSGHPKGNYNTGDDEKGTCPHQHIAPVSFHGNTRELT